MRLGRARSVRLPRVTEYVSCARRRSHIYDLNDVPAEYRAAFASAKGGQEARTISLHLYLHLSTGFLRL